MNPPFELMERWERLLQWEWELLSDIGKKNWSSEFADYLTEKDELLGLLGSYRLPRRLLSRVQRQQRRVLRALREGRRQAGAGQGLYTKDGTSRL